jgi:glucosamine kinase
MLLIADSGSTKTSWCLLNRNRKKIFTDTEGYNPYFVNSSYIVQSLKECLPAEVRKEVIDEIYFYGAGCFPEKTVVIQEALREVFPSTKSYIHLDLLAAARAALGEKAGFVAILGTGTNTCLYNGEEVSHQIDSLGYMLGDEGSGCAIGKKLIGDYLRDYMPAYAKDYFRQAYGLTPETILQKIYAEPLANRFCAGFSRFVGTHIADAYFHDLVHNAFCELFENIVSHYPNYKAYPFNCVGSVGYHFQAILVDVVKKFGMQPGRFLRAPIEDLVQYHEDHLC